MSAIPTLEQKAARYDQIMLDAKFNFEFWAKQYHEKVERDKAEKNLTPMTTGYLEGQTHAWAKVLWYAGLRPACPCSVCTEHRMEMKEKLLEQVQCAKTGEQL